jgi:hypothetical protein
LKALIPVSLLLLGTFFLAPPTLLLAQWLFPSNFASEYAYWPSALGLVLLAALTLSGMAMIGFGIYFAFKNYRNG